MNDSRYRWILYSIVFVILSTITIQVYWNYKNYQTNKQQLINDVQVSLDNAIDTYYADLAERSTMGFVFNANSQKDFFETDGKYDSLIESFELSKGNFRKIDSLEANSIKGITVFQGLKTDSLLNNFHLKHKTNHDSIQTNSEWLTIERLDSLSEKSFKILTLKIVTSMAHDTFSLKKIDSLLKNELNRKNLNINYGLLFIDDFEKKEQTLNADLIKSSSLSAFSKSTFLPNDSTLKVYFINETKIILKRILTGILISTLLVLAVISCLFYLLRIIKQQKQLAEIKNDFISNITHEFKTPIATISTALEAMKNFNALEDKAKTENYISIANSQVHKLNEMVEKILETASLNQEDLALDKKPINIGVTVEKLIDKYQLINPNKTFEFTNSLSETFLNLDEFHFKNALGNILDNAVKYGGKSVTVDLTSTKNNVVIIIKDSGNGIPKAQKEKVFEQFYRIPTGNIHTVKGFGIGLYYAKNIIEKHGGSLNIVYDKDNNTLFKIELLNE